MIKFHMKMNIIVFVFKYYIYIMSNDLSAIELDRLSKYIYTYDIFYLSFKIILFIILFYFFYLLNRDKEVK
jgi:hypothetical protein